jgi:lipopolysaccharide transport system ATP-binding protein
MGEDIAISLKNVSKCYKRYGRPVDRLNEILLPGKSRADLFWALQNINLEIPKGQTVGLIGRNGSGKSTLLQIITGTLMPTAGEVMVKGRISALLELGSGFNPEFTGRQNVFFNGRLLGLSQKEIEDKFDEIASFADIGNFIDQPVKTYSSGMFVRLAFAVAVNVNPEILIVDEALAVGDIVFQHRCMRRMRALMDSGVTTLFVSHDTSSVKTLCNWAVMIHDGVIHTTGLPNAVIIEYLKLLTELELGLNQSELQTQVPTKINNSKSEEKIKTINEPLSTSSKKSSRRGNGKALIESVRMLNQLGDDNGESPIFAFNEEVTLVVSFKSQSYLETCIVGFFICDKNGNEIIGSNTFEENVKFMPLQPQTQSEVRFKFPLPLRPASYSVTVAVAENQNTISCDWIDNAMVFQVLPPNTGKRVFALVNVNMQTEVLYNSLPILNIKK